MHERKLTKIKYPRIKKAMLIASMADRLIRVCNKSGLTAGCSARPPHLAPPRQLALLQSTDVTARVFQPGFSRIPADTEHERRFPNGEPLHLAEKEDFTAVRLQIKGPHHSPLEPRWQSLPGI